MAEAQDMTESDGCVVDEKDVCQQKIFDMNQLLGNVYILILILLCFSISVSSSAFLVFPPLHLLWNTPTKLYSIFEHNNLPKMANDEKKDDNATEVSGTDKAGNTIIKKNGKTYVQRKELPSVKDLLAHGDPETRDNPKTWCEIIGYPTALALVFAISLLIFHHAPHHLAPPRKKYSIPGMQRLPIFHRDRWQQHPHARMEEMRKKKMEAAQGQQQEPIKPEGGQQQAANTEL